MQSTEHIPAARTPSYHSLTGLSYTELWSSVHATYHHPAPTPNYHTGSFPGEQHQQLHELSPATGASVAASDACADMELSGSGSQWSGDSSVNGGNITLSKLEVARGVTSPERGQSTVMINATGTRDVTKLRPFPPSVSQNRLSMQAPPTTDRDQYSFDPRWIDSKILQGGERFKIADNDAADTLLSMKRAAVVHLNTAMSKSGGLKGLNLVDYGEGKTDAPQCVKMESPSRHDGDVLTLARHTDNKDSLHSWYWRNQEISHILSSAEADDSPPSTREPAPEPDSRSGRHHAVEGYQTGMYGNSKAINSNYWAGSPAVNRRDFSSSSWYYTRPVGDNLSNDFTSARWNVNAPPPVPKPQNLGRAKIMPTERGCGTLITHAVQQQKLKNSDIRNNQDGNQSPHSHKCHICGKSCTRPSSLRTHLRCHYGEKPFLCQLCGKSFSQAANLTAHMRIHSGEKPFKCRVCNRSFSQSSSVKTHMRTHTGERPYPCTYCSKSFSDSSTLSNHRRTHTGEKPYQCRVCCRSFSQSGNLNRHLRIHRRPGGGQNTPTNGLTALRE